MKHLFTLLFTLQIVSIYAQFNPFSPPNTYTNSDNPYYWKNRESLVKNGYWQQDVYYIIDADIDETTDIITGTEQLEYTNNSPHTLSFVYFHLYQNAFQPDAYLDELQKANKVSTKYGKYESKKLGTEVVQMKVEDTDCKTELDNTILKVYLNKPLKSGEKITFNIQFKTYFDNGGTTRRRMKEFYVWGNKHYDGVHWYPRICVYDKKFGWTTDQHLGKEFYGDYGAFDVNLTFNKSFVVEATGHLQNKLEVLPDTLRKRLDIANFKDKPYGSRPSVITPYIKGEKKTWKYHAENVHDFAFTADPTYRIGETNLQVDGIYPHNINVISLVQESHASGWQNAADFTKKVMDVYSKDFGNYAYNKMVVADAQDGMEYPMLTLNGGHEPDYRGLFAHEVGHNWFFGMVGNNETYRACLDEGFTQFLTAWSLIKIDGKFAVKNPEKNWYRKKFKKPVDVIQSNIYNPYLQDALSGSETTLNTHSDNFNGALGHGGGYRQVYYKTATMLYNLQYVLGDSLFLAAMQNYFDEWKMAHPYIEDFRNSIINFTHVDLNWFFDEWFETNKTIDYEVESVKRINKNNDYKITLEREGRMQMPIDLSITTKKDSVINVHIPNDWFVKNSSAVDGNPELVVSSHPELVEGLGGVKVLPKWFGWDNINERYSFNINVQNGIKQVSIDPSGRLADINRTNNNHKNKCVWSFDHRLNNAPNWNNYAVFWRPDVWYNKFEGIKAGLHLNGSYVNMINNFEFTAWANQYTFDKRKSVSTIYYLRTDQKVSPESIQQWENEQILLNKKLKWYNRFSYNFTYSTPLNNIIPKLTTTVQMRLLDGAQLYKWMFERKTEDQRFTMQLFAKSIRFYETTYAIQHSTLQNNKWNNYIGFNVIKNYNYSYGSGAITLAARSTAFLSDYNYQALSLTSINKNRLGKFDVNTRIFAQLGKGAMAGESALYAAGANQEEMMENKFVRSQAFMPTSYGNLGTITNHFQYGGGLNLRGYNGYVVPTTNKNGEQILLYASNSGAAINTEVGFDRLLKIRVKSLSNWLKINTYAFADAGVLAYGMQSKEFSPVRIDAGLGSTLTIKKWWVLEKTQPLVIRFDCPFFLNTPPFDEGKFVKFRWLVSVQRAF